MSDDVRVPVVNESLSILPLSIVHNMDDKRCSIRQSFQLLREIKMHMPQFVCEFS
jgi:hypothetical protein